MITLLYFSGKFSNNTYHKVYLIGSKAMLNVVNIEQLLSIDFLFFYFFKSLSPPLVVVFVLRIQLKKFV